MASAFGNLNGSGPQQIWLSLERTGYSQAGNYSSWRWEARYYGYGYGSWGANGSWSLSGFATRGATAFSVPQSEAYLQYKVLGSGTFTKGHDANGNLAAGTLTLSLTTDHGSIGSGSVGVGSGTVPRIPKPPTAPGTPALTPTATTVAATWTAPGNNNGAALLGYQAQISTNAAFTQNIATLTPSGRSATFTGRTPGTTQYVRVRARNAAGYGAWSGTASLDLWTAPDAPTLHYVAQTADATLRAEWDASGDGGSPILGYQLAASADAAFTVAKLTTATALARDALLHDVAPGAAYVRIRARNSAGYSSWSAAYQVTVTGSIGNLDGWSISTLPTGLTPVIGTGIRRTGTGIAIEATKGAAPTDTPAEFTLRRTFTDLKEGATYKLNATVQAGAATYPTTLGDANVSPAPQPWAYVVVADGPVFTVEVPVVVEIPEDATLDDWAANIQLSGLVLLEIREPSPYRLGDTVYEGPLAAHFDYACNTVGAGWWVARDGAVTFREWNSYPAIRATFSDEPGAALSYTDIAAAYDTRNVATVLTVSNHGRDAETGDADDADYIGENTAASADWGRREAGLDMTLYDPATFVGDRMAEILATTSAPEQTITQIKWNAQADPALAGSLEIQDRIDVTFRGRTQRCRILGITHDIKPGRWMQTLDLRKDA